MRIKFISNTTNAGYVFWHIRGDLKFLTQSAHKIMDGLRRDIYIILIPHMVSDGFKSQYPPPIDNQKMESIKLYYNMFMVNIPYSQ